MCSKGESVPVSKMPVIEEHLKYLEDSKDVMHAELARHFLFNGTKIIRARRPQGAEDVETAALAIVIRIGFNTTKGALLRSMLFPKPSGFKFYRDAFRYISVMATVAGIGFIASLINFIRLKLAWHLIIVRALDLITIVVPPALPATLTIGTNFALSRLKSKQIYCISPQRVNVGGKIDVVCFDKTGTLTEEDLDILEIRGMNRNTTHFSEEMKDVQSLIPASYERDPTADERIRRDILHAMVTCHSLKSDKGHLLGDPLDVKMFEFTGWTFEEGPQNLSHNDRSIGFKPLSIAKPPLDFSSTYGNLSSAGRAAELHTVKIFEFVSQLRRASVIVLHPSTCELQAFVKGAPDFLRDICRDESLPENYQHLLSYYTQRGYRVIACATKSLESPNTLNANDISREAVESDLTFLGFIIFENKLKNETTGVIEELSEAKIRNVMCTGDNILTAISVGRECGMIGYAPCFVPQFCDEILGEKQVRSLKWQNVDEPGMQLDTDTLTVGCTRSSE